MTLDKLKENESARIINTGGTGALRHHLLDMGLTPQTVVTLRKTAPMGDPIEIELRGYELTLRLAEAENIEIEPVDRMPGRPENSGRRQDMAHPGVGELGKADDYRRNRIGEKIPRGQPITFALAGNQNC
ncbi:MAG: ferrous iron transport protein A, partial [Acetatifactor sp.]|nr:ferrous iron transport protein A [Acetatifactor sp.]